MSIDWGQIISGAVQTGGQIYQQKLAQRAQRRAELRESIMMEKMLSGDQTHDSAISRTSPALIKRLGQTSAAVGVGGVGSCAAYGEVHSIDLAVVFLALGLIVLGARIFYDKWASHGDD